MQVRAILEAACNVQEQGGDVQPDIMVPLVGLYKLNSVYS
jgi:hypothetical protein